MVDYVQSIIASIEPDESIEEEVSEEDWQQLRKSVGDLFSQLDSEYHVCRTAYARRTDPHYDRAFDEYYVKAQLYWCSVRGDRYLVHDIPFLRFLLSPHDDVLRELFGISFQGLIDSIQKIQDSLTLGLGILSRDFRQFHAVTTRELEKKIEVLQSVSRENLRGLTSKVIEENAWEERRDSVLGRLLGLDLFDRNHDQIGKISKNNFEHVTVCAITLDTFSELAARVEHLRRIGMDVGEHPAWSVSISDLMVYADIFDNPLSFLHYVEQRLMR